MPLPDTFTKNAKHTGTPAGDKYSDGGGMYLLVNASGKYWRMHYRFADKRKTLALGICPLVSLAKVRQRRDKARELLADGIAKKEAMAEMAALSVNTFAAVALEWSAMKAKGCAANTSAKRLADLESHIFPAIGSRPVTDVKPPEILAMLQAVAATGTAYTAGRLREICGKVRRRYLATLGRVASG